MKVTVGMSDSQNEAEAVQEAVKNLGNSKLILFFAPLEKFISITVLLSRQFHGVTIVGTTNYYGYTQAGLSVGSLIVVSFEEGISFSCGILEEIKRYPMKFAPAVTKSLSEIPHDNTVCLEFTTAFSKSEELVVSTLDSLCSPCMIPVVGASAGMNDEQFGSQQPTYISLNGKVFLDATVFLMLHNDKGRIALFKENVYKPTSTYFTVTSVDVRNRIINELDGHPAVQVFAKALQCTPEEVPEKLRVTPLGRVVRDELYLCDFCETFADGSVSWNARIYNNTRICLVRLDDYKKITQQTFDAIHNKIASPSFTLLIHCLARTLYYKQIGFLDEYSRACAKNLSPLAGLSSTGEQLYDMHLNQTMIAVVFE